MKMKKFAALLMMFSMCLAVGCNDDDNDGPDPDPKPGINEIFAASTGTWVFDLNSFGGAFKTAYDEAKTALVAAGLMGEKGYVIQWMKVSKDNLDYMIYDEDFKGMGAPEEYYSYPGKLSLKISAVANTTDQIAFGNLALVESSDVTGDLTGNIFYDSSQTEQLGYCPKFKTFVDYLAGQNFTVSADNAENPKVLTFKGVKDTASTFKLTFEEQK
ncbi:hypothetical protein [Alistipes shahii]|jgi:hypothetical protein|uniref:hypothetical protein n=1 Tax=Alistipes shahii TaxID=328814 RepID=UPI00266C7C58|nr:hypothetical protein [Alistipes shahii]